MKDDIKRHRIDWTMNELILADRRNQFVRTEHEADSMSGVRSVDRAPVGQRIGQDGRQSEHESIDVLFDRKSITDQRFVGEQVDALRQHPGKNDAQRNDASVVPFEAIVYLANTEHGQQNGAQLTADQLLHVALFERVRRTPVAIVQRKGQMRQPEQHVGKTGAEQQSGGGRMNAQRSIRCGRTNFAEQHAQQTEQIEQENECNEQQTSDRTDLHHQLMLARVKKSRTMRMLLVGQIHRLVGFWFIRQDERRFTLIDVTRE